MRNRFGFFVVLLVGLASFAGLAAPDEPKPSSFTLRMDSSHWIVEGCEAEFLEAGMIRGAKGNGWVRSVSKVRDFILELDWRPEKSGFYDAGVFFRADLPPNGKSWPDFFQINLKTGAEAVLKNVQTESWAPPKTKPADWNHLKLVVEGERAHCEINGAPSWKTSGITNPFGFLALQVEEPLGGVVFFRDIKITEMGYKNLLAEGLDGWVSAEGDVAACWERKGDEIICTGAKGPWLRWGEAVGDFNLRLDYLLKEGGNSGVYIRVPEDGNHHGEASGIEVQILDDASPRYGALKPYQYSGSLYAIVPSNPRSARPASRWAALEIDCKADQYVVWQNGVEVVRATGASAPELMNRRLAGFIGLQNHSEEVRFRNLRLGASQQ